eukprot:Colp12_sorted_trinity150504_noHs@18250
MALNRLSTTLLRLPLASACQMRTALPISLAAVAKRSCFAKDEQIRCYNIRTGFLKRSRRRQIDMGLSNRRLSVPDCAYTVHDRYVPLERPQPKFGKEWFRALLDESVHRARIATVFFQVRNMLSWQELTKDSTDILEDCIRAYKGTVRTDVNDLLVLRDYTTTLAQTARMKELGERESRGEKIEWEMEKLKNKPVAVNTVVAQLYPAPQAPTVIQITFAVEYDQKYAVTTKKGALLSGSRSFEPVKEFVVMERILEEPDSLWKLCMIINKSGKTDEEEKEEAARAEAKKNQTEGKRRKEGSYVHEQMTYA